VDKIDTAQSDIIQSFINIECSGKTGDVAELTPEVILGYWKRDKMFSVTWVGYMLAIDNVIRNLKNIADLEKENARAGLSIMAAYSLMYLKQGNDDMLFGTSEIFTSTALRLGAILCNKSTPKEKRAEVVYAYLESIRHDCEIDTRFGAYIGYAFTSLGFGRKPVVYPKYCEDFLSIL
jgi:hypothetical protein